MSENGNLNRKTDLNNKVDQNKKVVRKSLRDRNLSNMSMNYDCKKCKSSPSIGSFNRLRYDNCAYAQDLNQSVSPLNYQMSRYKYENCTACTHDGKYYAPFDLVDYESELKNITRPGSLCNDVKYSPTCEKSEMCISTFEQDNPVVMIKNVCPVVCNNIKKPTYPGYTLNQRDVCGKRVLRSKKSERDTEMRQQQEESNLLVQAEKELGLRQ